MGLVSFAPRLASYGKRILNAYPEFVLGTGSDVVGAAMRSKKGSVLEKARAGFNALEKDIATKQATQGGFFKRLGKNLNPVNLWKSLKSSTKAGVATAKAAGKSATWGGVKGFFKGIGKKMPFIGAVLTLGFELPNIWTATKEQGIGTGLKETAKTAGRLTGGAIGGAIGAAVGGPIGAMVGWVAGEWLTSKVVGKTYSEKKAETMEAAAEAQAQAQTETAAQQVYQPQFQGNSYAYNSNPYSGMTNPLYNDYANPYANDIMMQQMGFNTLA